MKKLIRILAVIICFASPLWAFGVVLAISAPDSTPSVSNFHVNTNLLATGDILIYCDYDLPYGTPPDVFANQSFIFKLISTDNVTELGAIRPFVYFDNGYNEGEFGFYFNNMTTANITWGEPYIIRIAQNPAHFASPTSIDYVLPVNAYTTENTTAGNQLELSINILAAANRLGQVYTTYTLTEDSAGGTVLGSPDGETYFRGAIYGIQAMAPDLFMVQVLEYDTTYRTWTTAYSDNLTDRFETTWVGATENATATQFGVTKQTAMGFIPLTLSLGVIIVSTMKWRKAEPGLIATAVILIGALLMGWLAPAIFASLFQLMGIYIAYLIFLARAG